MGEGERLVAVTERERQSWMESESVFLSQIKLKPRDVFETCRRKRKNREKENNYEREDFLD